MNQAILFFQADQWKGSVLTDETRPELQWESGTYPNGEQWVKLNFPQQPLKRLIVVAGYHDREPLDVQTMRLLLVLESARRTAQEVQLILPYLPYSLQDRDVHGGNAVAARTLIRALESSGIDSVVVADLHNPESLREWSISAQEVRADELLAQEIERVYDRTDIAIVSPDEGAKERAQSIARILGVPLIELEKVRRGPGDVTVSGKITSCSAQHYVIVDDMINTGGTIVEAAQLVQEQCHVRVSVAVVHGLFAGAAGEKLKNAEIDHLFATNSFDSQALRPENLPSNWHVVDIGLLFRK